MVKEDWDSTIHEIIKQARTTISLNEIYKAIETHSIVTHYHRQPWKPGGQPRYQCWTRRCLTNLISKKSIKRVGRALYLIS